MFGKSVLVKLTRTTTAGVEKITAEAEERTLVEGVGDGFKALYDDDIAVGGIGPMIAFVGSSVLTAYGTNRVLSGRWNVNPFSA